MTDDKGLYEYIKKMKGHPEIFIAMQAEGREWVTLFSPEAIAQFDYIFSDALTWRDHKGRRMRLWKPEEVFVEDKQQFMDMYVQRIVWIIENEPIDIFVNPTMLPAVLAPEYDTLWTEARKMKMINAAVRNNVAIEIKLQAETAQGGFYKESKTGRRKVFLRNEQRRKRAGQIGILPRNDREMRTRTRRYVCTKTERGESHPTEKNCRSRFTDLLFVIWREGSPCCRRWRNASARPSC